MLGRCITNTGMEGDRTGREPRGADCHHAARCTIVPSCCRSDALPTRRKTCGFVAHNLTGRCRDTPKRSARRAGVQTGPRTLAGSLRPPDANCASYEARRLRLRALLTALHGAKHQRDDAARNDDDRDKRNKNDHFKTPWNSTEVPLYPSNHRPVRAGLRFARRQFRRGRPVMQT
jgi:hypothetical protein